MLMTQMLRFEHLGLGMKMKPFVSSMGISIRNITTMVLNVEKKTKRGRPAGEKGEKIKWTDEQSRILRAVSDGKSVFITGSAGTGKTMLLKEIIKKLRKMHGKSRVYVTASTGVAACALNGQTLHSFAGVGVVDRACLGSEVVLDGKGLRNCLLNKVFSDRRALRRWENAKALVIDEISMVDAELFENLEFLSREIRGEKDKVWGGLQVVGCGDFLQLPPIIHKDDAASGKEFAFEADCWDSTFDEQAELFTVFRQADTRLVKMLQGIRRGKCDFTDFQLIKGCYTDVEPEESVVRLYPRNADVNKVNEMRLSSLGKKRYVYNAVDTGKDPWRRQLMQGVTPTQLEIAEGARVMLTKNLDVKQKLVNGAVGTVIGFKETNATAVRKLGSNDGLGLLPIVKFDSGRELVVDRESWYVMEGDQIRAQRIQIPLVLAWAMSIHKCQGMTLERLHTNLSKAFGYGMVYVALSRVTSLEGLHLSGFKLSKIKAHPKVLQFYESFGMKQEKELLTDNLQSLVLET